MLVLTWSTMEDVFHSINSLHTQLTCILSFLGLYLWYIKEQIKEASQGPCLSRAAVMAFGSILIGQFWEGSPWRLIQHLQMVGQELVDACDGLVQELSIVVNLGHQQLGPHEVASYPQPLLDWCKRKKRVNCSELRVCIITIVCQIRGCVWRRFRIPR